MSDFIVFLRMMNKLHLALLLSFSLLSLLPFASAETFILPPSDTALIGQDRIVYARYEDTLMDIASKYSIGYDEILKVNPDVDRWLPGDGTPVVLPTRYILPETPREGIVLNLPEMRMYYYPPVGPGGIPTVQTYPVGIGRMDWATPLGVTRIVAKVRNPTWTPPASIKREHLEMYNEVLPNVVSAGPDNPLGLFAMRLGIPGYLIHGTNKKDGVGSRVSHGCVRMYNDDIAHLFPQVPEGSVVRIINQPVKVGRLAGALFIEAHAPFVDDYDPRFEPLPPNEATIQEASRVIEQKYGALFQNQIDWESVHQAIEQGNGRVIRISG